MKFLTKKWLMDYELHEIQCLLKPQTNKKIPFIFTNSGTESIAKENLHTVETDLNLTDKENKIDFIMLPDTFDYLIEYHNDATEPDRKSLEEDFKVQYVDRMRIITYLPDDILKRINDKRMLAFGYVGSEVKSIILDYIEEKNKVTQTMWNAASTNTELVERGLTFSKQFGKDPYAPTLIELLDMVNILNAEPVGKDIHLTLETGEILILTNAEVIEQEESVINAYVRAIELHKKRSGYELHLLVMKRDVTYTAHFYYVTYSFKDMQLNEVL